MEISTADWLKLERGERQEEKNSLEGKMGEQGAAERARNYA